MRPEAYAAGGPAYQDSLLRNAGQTPLMSWFTGAETIGAHAFDDATAIPLSVPASASHSAECARPHAILLVAATYALPYQVLRCAKECSARVVVLGDLGGQALTLSRYCDRFVRSHRTLTGAYDEGLVLEINAIVRDEDITVILPGDALATRALIACGDRLNAPCFPMPDIEHFDRLNDKWRFAKLCAELGLPHPPTRWFPDVASLETELSRYGAGEDCVLKPLSLSGNQGVIQLNRDRLDQQLRDVNYQPILMQEFIPGQDISATVFCREGHVLAFIVHSMHRRIYTVVESSAAMENIRRLAATLAITGIFNFDMRLTPDDRIYFLECNPRFSFRIRMGMLAGLNFIDAGLSRAAPSRCVTLPVGTQVRVPEALILSPRLWPTIRLRDMQTASHMLADPFPLLFDQIAWPV